MDRRLKVFKILIVILLVLLIFKAGYLQLIKGDYYHDLSEGNRISMRPINAPQGRILTNSTKDNSEYKVMVSNRLSYNLYLLPNEVPEELKVDDLLERLVKIVKFEKVSVEKIKQDFEILKEEKDFKKELETKSKKTISDLQELKLLKENFKKNRETNSLRSLPVLLKKNISSENMLIIESNKKDLPGILVKESTIREYVYEDLACHVLDGLENKYTGEKEKDYLTGTDGYEQIEINNIGKEMRTLGIKPPQPGHDLILNIDLDLQQYIKKNLTKELINLRKKAEEDKEISKPTGAGVIVMDPNSGAVKAMSSIPGYNLNLFAQGISAKQFRHLSNNKLKPLFNRNIMAEVPPGSVFKLVTGATAIENLDVSADSIFYDEDGTFSKPEWNTTFRNWYPVGEGKLDFTRAIARSNNIIFYKLGYRLYKKYRGSKLVEFSRKFGLGTETGIDLPGEKSGLVPDGEWKKEKFGSGWLPGDSINLSIGQGNLLTTPLQIAQIASIIANGGIMFEPFIVDKVIDAEGKLIKDIEPEIKKKFNFDNDVFSILKQGMIEVTQSQGGTASEIFRDFPISVAGKTGTAQTSIKKANHGWFVGFAPADDPKIVVLVFLENGSSSSNATPIAADIFREYFKIENNKKESNQTSVIDESENNNSSQTNKTPNSFNLFDYFEKVFSPRE